MLKYNTRFSLIPTILIFLLIVSNVQPVKAQVDKSDCRYVEEDILPAENPRLYPISPVSDMSVSPDGTILGAIYNGHLAFYSTETRDVISLLPLGTDGEYRKFAWSPDGEQIALNTADAIQIWDVDAAEMVASLDESTFLREILWEGDGEYLVWLASSGLHVWDTEAWEQVGVLFEQVSPYGEEFDTTIQIEWLASSESIIITERHQLFVWDFQTSDEPDLMVERLNTGYIFQAIDLSADGELLASGNEVTSSLELWNTTTWILETELLPRPSNYWEIDWSPDSTQVAIAGQNTIGCTVAIWGIEPVTEIFEYLGTNPGLVSHVAWTPDSEQLFVALHDGTLYQWEVATETLLGTINLPDINTESSQ